MIKIDTSELDRLEKGLNEYKSILPKSVATSALRNALRPMLQHVKSGAPIGEKKSTNGWGRYTGPDYARGGYTRRHARVKMVPSKINAGEVAKGLVGIDRRKGKVGWRTHFITTGYTDRAGKKHGPNDFLQRAFNATIEVARASFGKDMSNSFQKWAKKNLPQKR